MARIGNNVVFRAVKREDVENALESVEQVAYRETHYAMREDGVVLSRFVVGFLDHFNDHKVKRHDYGWKVASRKPRHDLRDYLQSRGYTLTT